MTKDAQSRSPIVRFLGEDAGRGGPFALLGLRHSIKSDEEIHRARSRRLRQIDCHPQRSTPDADEARLAVHSAATQLVDPQLREQLALRWPEGIPVDLPKAWNPSRAMQRITPAIVRHARLIVGSSGGWNTVARRRLAHLARLHRISATEIIQQLGRGVAGAGSRSTSISGSAILPSLPDPPRGRLGWVPAYALIGVLSSSLLATLLLHPRAQDQDRVPDDAYTALESDVSPLLDKTDAESTVPRDRLSHYTAIAHELDRLVARAGLEPEAAMLRFGEVYAEFTREWLAFPEPALQRAGSNIAEFVSRLDAQQIPAEEIAPLLSNAGLDPDRLMIAAGVINVVISSSPLRSETQDQLREIRSRMTSVPMTSSTELLSCAYAVAMDQAIRNPGDDPEWWSKWLEGAEHASESEGDQARVVLEALGHRLRDESPPGQAWQECVSLLVRALDWREESIERYWLLAQFSDTKVTTARLSMLTEALVTESAAKGVDQLMVLSPNANAPQREQISNRYRLAWFPKHEGENGIPAGGATGPLIRELQIACNSTPDRISDEQAVGYLIELARLTTSAFLAIDGHNVLSEELLQNPPDLPAAPDPGELNLRWSQEDDDWAERAVNCDEAAQLRPYLDELISRDRIGISSANALVYIASRKAQPELRELALAQIDRFSDQLTILIAIDQTLSDIRVSARVDSLVRRVLGDNIPSRNSENWYPLVRSELLSRMGKAMRSADDLRYSQLQVELARLHVIRLDAGGHEPFDADDPMKLLDQLNQQLRSASDSMINASSRLRQERAEIDAQTMLRSVRSGTPLQMYYAQQRREIAYVAMAIRYEYPDTERLVISIISDLNQRTKNATTAVQQAAQAARGLARLQQVMLQRRGTL